MAYMSQERKAKIAVNVKSVLKKYSVKGSLSVRNHSTLVLSIKQGAIDFVGNMNKTCAADHYQVANGFTPVTREYIDVNPYHFQKHFDGKAKKFMTEVFAALNDGNHDRSDSQSDYFDVGWYVDVNVGQWNRPYALVK